MEKKNKSFVFVILAMMIIIAIMGYFIYNLYIEKTNTKEEINNLKNQIISLESKNNEAQEENGKNENTNANTETNNNKYTEISSELNGIDVLYVTNVIKDNDIYTLQGVLYTQYSLSGAELQEVISKGTMKINNKNYIIKSSSNSKEYDLYDSAQNEIAYKIKETDENTYYLEAQAQISDVWKLTNEYKEIKVSKDTKCSMLFDYEEKYNTVEDVFNNYSEENASETTNPNLERTFKFKFTNGKCTEVINVLTSL